MERVREAIALVEERFADQKLRSHGMQSNKDILLTVLALGLADDLLQSQKKLDDVQNRIETMLSKIKEESVKSSMTAYFPGVCVIYDSVLTLQA